MLGIFTSKRMVKNDEKHLKIMKFSSKIKHFALCTHVKKQLKPTKFQMSNQL